MVEFAKEKFLNENNGYKVLKFQISLNLLVAPSYRNLLKLFFAKMTSF
jgi:hypothetical protein